jgi:hypothetical protein
MTLEFLKSKTGRTLFNHVILTLSKAKGKNPYYGSRDPSVAEERYSHRPDVLREGDMIVVNS